MCFSLGFFSQFNQSSQLAAFVFLWCYVKKKLTQLFPSKPHQVEKRKMKSVRRVTHTYEHTLSSVCGMCYFFLSCCGSLDCIVLQTALQPFLPQDAVSAAAKSLTASTAGTDWSLPSHSFICLMCHYHVLWSPVWPKACNLLHREWGNTFFFYLDCWSVTQIPRHRNLLGLSKSQGFLSLLDLVLIS